MEEGRGLARRRRMPLQRDDERQPDDRAVDHASDVPGAEVRLQPVAQPHEGAGARPRAHSCSRSPGARTATRTSGARRATDCANARPGVWAAGDDADGRRAEGTSPNGSAPRSWVAAVPPPAPPGRDPCGPGPAAGPPPDRQQRYVQAVPERPHAVEHLGVAREVHPPVAFHDEAQTACERPADSGGRRGRRGRRGSARPPARPTRRRPPRARRGGGTGPRPWRPRRAARPGEPRGRAHAGCARRGGHGAGAR